MISDEFNSKVWVYFETNLKPRTRKEYWKIVNDFDKEVVMTILHSPAKMLLNTINT